MTRLTQRLATNEFANREIPRFASPERQSRFLANIQQELAEASGEAGLLRSFLREMQYQAEPRNSFCLPWSAQRDPPCPARDWIVTSLLRFPEAGPVIRSEVDDTCHVLVDGQSIMFPEDRAESIEYIFHRGDVTVESLVSGCAPDMPPERMLECLIALVKCGAICLREPGYGAVAATAAR